jgi:hypothetical protein
MFEVMAAVKRGAKFESTFKQIKVNNKLTVKCVRFIYLLLRDTFTLFMEWCVVK